MIPVIKYPKQTEWNNLSARPVIDNSSLYKDVSRILNIVKKQKDKALIKLTKQYDNVILQSLQVDKAEIEEAKKEISDELAKALKTAMRNIEIFHTAQKEPVRKIITTQGVTCWRKSVAIEKAGLYIPGGSAPLFSTVLMLAVPAKIAGCKEIILCTPPDKSGKIHPAILYAAQSAGVTKIFKTGGAQAIAAMAYGTATIPKVDKIFGPGNQYVTCAKQLVQLEGVAIDMPAGPSELLVMADNTAIPEFVAADLLSQTEHGADSQVILVSNSENIIRQTQQQLKLQLKKLPRRDIAAKALANSKAILVKDMNEAIEFVNAYAPEHLIISCKNDEKLADKIINAGSVFLGNYSPESAGDYASGTNHTLPTNGFARCYSGVSLDSFIKKITYQKLSKQGLKNIAAAVETMAENEGLTAHKNAVSIRLNKK